MTDTANNETLSPADQAISDRIGKDIERHLVMKGHPPTGSTSPGRSASEIKKRIAESKARLKKSDARIRKYEATKRKQGQAKTSLTT